MHPTDTLTASTEMLALPIAPYALSLFGRAQDRLSHVLVSEPFESLTDCTVCRSTLLMLTAIRWLTG